MHARKPTTTPNASKRKPAEAAPLPPRRGRPPKAESRPTPRDALLAAADELFYKHGIQASSIDALARHARVSKASLYHEFGSKAEIAHAYLAAREHAFSNWFRLQMHIGPTDPRGKLLWVFTLVTRFVQDPRFHGCAFINAATECRADTARQAPFEPLLRVARTHKADLRTFIATLASQAGVADAPALAAALALLIDGLLVSASMAANDTEVSHAITAATNAANDLLNAALARAAHDPRTPGSR